jgi:hypothetical protein
MKEKEITHIQVNVKDKEKLEELRDQGGYASIRVVLNKLLKKCGGREI